MLQFLMLSEGCLGSIGTIATISWADELFQNLVGPTPLELLFGVFFWANIVPEVVSLGLNVVISTQR